jgi:hypothetical protein
MDIERLAKAESTEMSVGDLFNYTCGRSYQNPDGTDGRHEFDLLVRITGIESDYANWETVKVLAERGRPAEFASEAPKIGGVVPRLMTRVGFTPASRPDNQTSSTGR